MDIQKLIKQLFVGKVSDILGFEKTTELLKEATDAINAIDVGRSEQYCEHEVTEQKSLRCTCCAECGEILDVLD